MQFQELTISLYVDDVVIICHPDKEFYRGFAQPLRFLVKHLFGEASGLHTNFAHCSVTPIAFSEVALEASKVMRCQLAPFPVKYLGIPLAVTWASTPV